MTNVGGNIFVPVLLISGGLLFLIVALSKRIAVVEISPHFRRLSAFLGILLLFGGVGLYAFTILLNTLSSFGQSSRAETNLPTPVATDILPSVAPTPMLTPLSQNFTGVIEGPVEAVNGKIIVVYGIEIEIALDDPLFDAIQVGDVIRIEGDFGREGVTIMAQDVTAVSLLSSLTPLPTRVSTLVADGGESTPQATINMLATEGEQTAVVVQPETNVVLTAAAVDSILTSTTNLTATLTPAVTPPPTNTLFPISTVLQENVETLFQDEFNRDRLSIANWQSHGIEPVLRNDRLIFEGVNRWGDSIARTGITENEGVFLLFRYTTGQMEMYLESGEFGESDYRRWGFVRYGSQWEVNSVNGEDSSIYGSVRLRAAEWNYLLLRVGHDGHLYTQVWEADDPSGFIVNLDSKPAGGNWENRVWRFVL